MNITELLHLLSDSDSLILADEYGMTTLYQSLRKLGKSDVINVETFKSKAQNLRAFV